MRDFLDRHRTDMCLFAVVCACAGFFGFIAQPEALAKGDRTPEFAGPPPVMETNKLPLLIDVPRDFQPPED